MDGRTHTHHLDPFVPRSDHTLIACSTDNAIKNHWYSTMRRNMRRIAKEMTKQIKQGGDPASDTPEDMTFPVPRDFAQGGTPKQQVQLSQFAENLSNGDAALFQRCYSLLQNSISSGRQSRGVQKVRTPTTGDAAALSRLLV
jgi:hypothetical protein